MKTDLPTKALSRQMAGQALVYRGCLVWAIHACLCLGAIQHASATITSTRQHDSLQTFASSRHIIEELIFEDIPAHLSFEQSALSNKVRRLYLVRLSNQDFFLRQLSSLEELQTHPKTPLGRVTVGYGDHFAVYAPEAGLMTYVRVPGDRSFDSPQNSVMGALRADKSYCSFVWNMGVPNFPSEALHWSNHMFSQTNHIGVHWAGEMIIDPSGIVRGLKLRNALGSQRRVFEVAYGYENVEGVPSFLPTTIDFKAPTHKGRLVPSKKFKIYSLKTNTAPLSATLFDVKDYTFSNRMRLYYTNGHIVYFANGQPRVATAFVPEYKKDRSRIKLLALLSGAVLGMFGFGFYRRHRSGSKRGVRTQDSLFRTP